MFFNAKQLVFQRVSTSAYLEIGTETTLDYYIVDAGVPVTLNTVEYKIDKAEGRSMSSVVAWTSIDLSSVTGDIYSLPITITGVTQSDALVLTIKVTDSDNVETFYKDTEVAAI